MANQGDKEPPREGRRGRPDGLPAPSAAFRRRAWVEFQKALDPLAPPKPLKISRH